MSTIIVSTIVESAARKNAPMARGVEDASHSVRLCCYRIARTLQQRRDSTRRKGGSMRNSDRGCVNDVRSAVGGEKVLGWKEYCSATTPRSPVAPDNFGNRN